MKRETYNIDAANKSLGRLSSEIVILLRGKNKPDFAPHKDEGSVIMVKNVGKIKITGRKIEQKKYFHHTGYLGGLKETPLKKIFPENPKEVLKKAVMGMLPKNRLRRRMIKRLKFE